MRRYEPWPPIVMALGVVQIPSNHCRGPDALARRVTAKIAWPGRGVIECVVPPRVALVLFICVDLHCWLCAGASGDYPLFSC